MDVADRFAELREFNPEALLADGFEDAYLGFVRNGVAVYSRAKCIAILMERDGMTHEDADEFFAYNTESAFVGPFTPLYLYAPEDQ